MSAAGKLMMDYLETALEVFGFYSIPVEGELKVFQVLQKKKRMITVQTFKSKQERRDASRGWQWLVQPLEIWRAHAVGPGTNELAAFKLQDADWTNMLAMTGVGLTTRGAWLEWRGEGISDVEATQRIVRVCIVRPRQS